MRLRRTSALAAGIGLLLVSAAPAAAVTPPQVDPQTPPPAGNPGPVAQMTANGECITSGVLPGSDPAAVSRNQLALKLPDAWKHSRGQGQTVAVIDTGVTPGPRLPHVESGGDFVESTDGRTDCDGHGTLVAGLIAGQPGEDGFSGVAPGARILSIRQTSQRFSPRGAGGDPTVVRASLEATSLARAVVRAADLGARVINISVVSCVPANKTVDQAELGAALRYAAEEKDAVIVAAAGNTRGGTSVGGACESNPLSDSGRPDDKRNWSGVTSVSIPSWWQPYVLSVGSVNADGQPSNFSMAGPWVGVSAPGEQISSVSNAPGGGLANGLPNNQQEQSPISGTSYSAAYVSGVAALVRSKFPELKADQVKRRITASAAGAARAPSNLVGSGMVDPVAALTWDIPQADTTRPDAKPVVAPPPPPPRDHTPRTVAFAGAGVLAALVLVAAFIVRQRKGVQK